MIVNRFGFPFVRGYEKSSDDIKRLLLPEAKDLMTNHLVTWVPEEPRDQLILEIVKIFQDNQVSFCFKPNVPRGMVNPEWGGHFIAVLNDPIALQKGADLQQAVDAIELFNEKRKSCYDLPSSLEAIVIAAWRCAQEITFDPLAQFGIVCSDDVVVRRSKKDEISILPLNEDRSSLDVFPVKRF